MSCQSLWQKTQIEKTHAIVLDDLLNPRKPLITPFMLKGVTSYLPVSKFSVIEYHDEYTPHIIMIKENQY